MDKSLLALTDALKKNIARLKGKHKTLSFVLLIGKTRHGKTALLRQSAFEQITIDAERSCEIYHNDQGIILEINESWLHESTSLLEQTLKQLNQTLRISGLLLAIDINDLFDTEASEITQKTQQHAKLLQRFGKALGYAINTGFIFTKLDSLAGFSDFFQHDERVEQQKPLGFSIDWGRKNTQIANNFHARFNHLLESLSQDVLQKIHPARSSLKRMLIREFPLQLANFHLAIQTLLKQVPPKLCNVSAIYFTSAEQGGMSQDHLNQKICHEYALTLPNQMPQSNNYRPYFIDGALNTFQAQTQHAIPKPALSQKYVLRLAATAVGVFLAFLVHHHVTSSQALNDVTKQLLAYDANSVNHTEKNHAIYHLAQASDTLDQIKISRFLSPALQHLQITLQTNANQQLLHDFLPSAIQRIEQALRNPGQTPVARYNTLKAYIALSKPDKRSEPYIISWFETEWKKEAPNQDTAHLRLLLEKTVLDPKQTIILNPQLIRDNRNYLNALPAGYLYYSLLKNNFPTDTQKLQWNGFMLGAHAVPVYFTKPGFHTLSAKISNQTIQFQTDNWILERQDLSQLSTLLEQAYAYDYLTWWKQFIKRTTPTHIKNYIDARQRLEVLDTSDTLRDITHFIQTNTRPDLDNQNSIFNQTVANQFTELNLMTDNTLRDLSFDIHELRLFSSTLAVTQDEGHTAFTLTKARFQNKGPRNALSSLYLTTKQLPQPIALWSKQLADDTWFLLINDAKHFINMQWRRHVFPEYQRTVLNRYPFKNKTKDEVSLHDFNRFFSTHGILNRFVAEYIKPFLNTSTADWSLQAADDYVLPISDETIQQLIRANIITAMFFPEGRASSHINFSLQKMNLDPVIASLELSIGDTHLKDTQSEDTVTDFEWPQSDAELILNSIEGKQYELAEDGPWAFFKLLSKLNVLMDKNDSASLHVLFEINGDSGRYLLKTANILNPFTPGILSDFNLDDSIA
ncbi:MAG: type IVB secretion system protein IcmF [Gammaproteobacteria bacterium]|nr:type IVB secretion system protein IcmF [Gammaproteobacteria bacterium]